MTFVLRFGSVVYVMSSSCLIPRFLSHSRIRMNCTRKESSVGGVRSMTGPAYSPSMGEEGQFEGTSSYTLNSGEPGPTVRPYLKEKRKDFGSEVEK